MNNRGLFGKVFIIILILVLVVVGVVGYYLYYIFIGPSYGGEGVILQNPVANLTTAEAVEQFDESFVLFLLYSIGVNELHNPPFSSDKPKIELYVSDDVYNAFVERGAIGVQRGAIEGEDIIIRTTREEGVKMLQNSNYVADSFRAGLSSIELVASKTKLAPKGYLKIYTSLTGESV